MVSRKCLRSVRLQTRNICCIWTTRVSRCSSSSVAPQYVLTALSGRNTPELRCGDAGLPRSAPRVGHHCGCQFLSQAGLNGQASYTKCCCFGRGENSLVMAGPKPSLGRLELQDIRPSEEQTPVPRCRDRPRRLGGAWHE